MTDLIKLAHNATVAKLIDAPREAKVFVSELLSYMVEGAEHMHAFRSGGWNGRSSFFSMVHSTFPAGFVHLVHSELTRKGYRVQLVRRPLPKPLGPENPIVDEFGNDDPRYDYQMKVVDRLLKHGRGIAQIATGGGKSKVAKLAVARIRRMTLFLTTRGVLMHQMADSFREAGYNVGILGDGEWRPTKGINCAMVQTLVSYLKQPDLNAEIREIVKQTSTRDLSLTREDIVKVAKHKYDLKVQRRNRTIKLLELVEFVIGEEAHEAGGNSYYEILQHCKNANYRLALTATPFMKANGEDNMRLMAAFGPILIKVSEKMLIERGILAKPYFKFCKVEPHPKLRRTSPWQRARSLGIVDGPHRNAKIVEYARKAASYGLPTIVLVGITRHGDLLKKKMQEAGLKVAFIQGEDNQAERKAQLTALKDGEIDVLIGTTILDVGVDVPAVGMVILAGGGKAEVALRQRIGRGLRAKKTGPNVCFIVDFADDLNTHLKEHARTRRAIVESTPGFAENILSDHEDFDWSVFEMRKAA